MNTLSTRAATKLSKPTAFPAPAQARDPRPVFNAIEHEREVAGRATGRSIAQLHDEALMERLSEHLRKRSAELQALRDSQAFKGEAEAA
ncbi:hypothetical protein LA345_12950 [Burkholderia vietnamiensis]|uniref:Uncharacterized protein n=1 Tax=Burkholderia vietnamiensis (strain G4 / LMG 22486) TaxID=269482 RepID=A4JFK7_BURVG|nr:hypothetical protein Bcep1808_2058 [Burkholderia vietnamiensis G4]MCB4344820.1 hypothetical protein [Burkholderia vietnamiensis]